MRMSGIKYTYLCFTTTFFRAVNARHHRSIYKVLILILLMRKLTCNLIFIMNYEYDIECV